MSKTRDRIFDMIALGDPFGVGAAIAGEIDAKDKRIAEFEGLLRESATMIKNAVVSVTTLTAAGDMLAARLDSALAEVELLTPYALAQIARLRYASISDELEDAEDELERRAVGKELADWDQTTIRAIKLMEARWERDRKTLVRVKLADMVMAACS